MINQLLPVWQPHPDVVYRDGDGSGRETVKVYRYCPLPGSLPISRAGIIPLVRAFNKALTHRIIMEVVNCINDSLHLCYIPIITTALLPETIWPVCLMCFQIFQTVRIMILEVIYGFARYRLLDREQYI